MTARIAGLSYGGRCLASRFGWGRDSEPLSDLFFRFALKAEREGDLVDAEDWLRRAADEEERER